jgi:hypothetical protein
MGNVPRDQDAMSDSTGQLSDFVFCIKDQLPLDIRMDVDSLISLLTKVNVGEMYKNCRHLIL